MDLLPYNPRLKKFARELRNRSTLAEVLLWRHLKGRQRLGFDFHRQKPILEWIADFYSAELKLAVEIDGDSHRARPEQDRAKESALRALGIDLLRFGDTETKRSAEGVAWQIDDWIRRERAELVKAKALSDKHTPPFGHPSLEGTSAVGATTNSDTALELPPLHAAQKSPLERGGAQRRGV